MVGLEAKIFKITLYTLVRIGFLETNKLNPDGIVKALILLSKIIAFFPYNSIISLRVILIRHFVEYCVRKIIYSVLSATTGSFLAALFEGIMPANIVRMTLIRIRAIPTTGGKYALKLPIPVK